MNALNSSEWSRTRPTRQDREMLLKSYLLSVFSYIEPYGLYAGLQEMAHDRNRRPFAARHSGRSHQHIDRDLVSAAKALTPVWRARLIACGLRV